MATRKMFQIDALPAFSDNYIWLLQDHSTRRCAVVDPGDAAPVLAWLQAHGDWQLSDILITHHHPDHVGGVATLKAATGARVCGPARENIPARDLALDDGADIKVLCRTKRIDTGGTNRKTMRALTVVGDELQTAVSISLSEAFAFS